VFISPDIAKIMEETLIGRIAEQETLHRALSSQGSEMVAILGRRRVGKTFLVRSVCDPNMVFEATGVQNGTLKKQLQYFNFQLNEWFGADRLDNTPPTDWLDAFHKLITALENQAPRPNKRVLFFDELPWFDSRKSGFLEAFGLFWNSWASRKNVMVIICGSAASWMIQRVVDNKGGLHNRITQRIHLQPFTLAETEAFLRNRGAGSDRYQILHLYMALGGIPHYLAAVQPGLSAAQNIQHILFSPSGLLRNEFLRLYPALFDHAENHITAVRALAEKRRGLTRKELIASSGLTEGGNTTQLLRELEESGFISTYFPFGNGKKEKIYRLTDEYSLFYLNFVENKPTQSQEYWKTISQTQHYKTWSGYAFENICLKHVDQIKRALGISGIYTEDSAFLRQSKGELTGVQIDLLLDRKDNIVNLCELKFYNDKFSLDKADADALRQKITLFKAYTKTRKLIFLNIITTYGLIPNEHSIGLVDKALGMDALFLDKLVG
jgi:AAA+ ATPase superfamily predicted ATPase